MKAYRPIVVPQTMVAFAADRRAAPDACRAVPLLPCDLRPGFTTFVKTHDGPPEHVVRELDAVVERDVVLDLHTAAILTVDATFTFWPMLHSGPISAPFMTCEKCQMRVPFPIDTGSST